MPVFHLIAGSNGAGKSTLYRYLIQPRYPQLPFINADVHEHAQLGHIRQARKRSEAARAWADSAREACLQEQSSFVSETVFSHPSKLQLIADAQARGFEVVLYAVCVDEPRRLLTRVQQRVSEGGHSVPVDRVLARYPRTVEHLRLAVRQVQLALLFDGADVELGGPQLVASVVGGQVHRQAARQPAWVLKVLGI